MHICFFHCQPCFQCTYVVLGPGNHFNDQRIFAVLDMPVWEEEMMKGETVGSMFQSVGPCRSRKHAGQPPDQTFSCLPAAVCDVALRPPWYYSLPYICLSQAYMCVCIGPAAWRIVLCNIKLSLLMCEVDWTSCGSDCLCLYVCVSVLRAQLS